jgi:biotin carboxylase
MSKKKLIILCSVPQMIRIVQRANFDGIHTIVLDNVPNSPCKKIACESYDISVLDLDSIVNLGRKLSVDGIINYCIDSGQLPYFFVAKELNLPCYGTYDQFQIMTNKEVFKNSCMKYGLDVLKSYDVNDCDVNINSIDYPVIIKPVDGRASKGVNICFESSQFHDMVNDSLLYSKVKRVVVEEFIQNGQEVAIKYFVCNGEISLTSMSDIYTHYDTNGNRDYIWSQVFPSKHYEHYIHEYDNKVRSFIRSIGISNGPLSFSGFRVNDKYYFIDPSFRMGGAEDWEIVKANSGVDISEIMTKFAITGSMGDPSVVKKTDKSITKNHSMMLYILIKKGVIGKIEGLEKCTNISNVVSYHVMFEEGDSVEAKGTAQHVLMRFIIVAKNKREMIETGIYIQNQIMVFNDKGEDMLIEKFPLNNI